MIPTVPSNPTPADDTAPRFFLNDTLNADPDGDWWLDLGAVDLPTHTAA